MSVTVPISEPVDSISDGETTPVVREREDGQRADLARKLVNVLALPSGQINENERAFTGDILIELLSFLSLDLKIELTNRMAGALAPPPNLLRRLLTEPLDVAGPLIQAFKDIPDSMLIEAAQVGPEHRKVICQRTRVSDAVAEALFDAGDIPIAVQLLSRPDIVLADWRVDQLVNQTMRHEELREPLLHRRELQPRHGFMMFWWLDEGLRRQALGRFAIDRTLIQNAIDPVFKAGGLKDDADVVVKRILTLCDRRHRPRNKKGDVVSAEMVERMLVAVRANPAPDLCAAVALLAGVSTDTASRTVYDKGGEPFSILCKSIGVSRKTFATILEKSTMFRKPDAGGPTFGEEDHERLIGAFDMVARDYSRTILRYWDWRREAYDAVAPL